MSSSHGAGFAIVPAEVLELGNGYAIAVYAAIAQHADRNGEAFPSVRRLGEITGWSRTTIHKTIDELEVAVAIVREARTKNGLIRSNLYRLPLHGRESPRNGMSTSLPTENLLFISRPTLSTSRSLVGKEVDTEQEPKNKTQRTRERAANADPLAPHGSDNGRNTPIPTDFAPDPEQRSAIQEELRLTDAFLDSETAKFRDWYRDHPKESADWQAAWRYWVRKGIEHSRKNGGPSPFQAPKPHTPLKIKEPVVEGEGNPMEAIRKARQQREAKHGG